MTRQQQPLLSEPPNSVRAGMQAEAASAGATTGAETEGRAGGDRRWVGTPAPSARTQEVDQGVEPTGQFRVYSRRCGRRRQDLGHARRGLASLQPRLRRRDRLRRDPRPGAHRPADPRPAGRASQGRGLPGHDLRGDGPCRRCSPASPRSALIDELAHTNVPGSGSHPKRWEGACSRSSTRGSASSQKWRKCSAGPSRCMESPLPRAICVDHFEHFPHKLLGRAVAFLPDGPAVPGSRPLPALALIARCT